ncbi:MAG TPA: hypothetical protein VMN36_18350 [Verrucomicrobiales bacterium]|nr:hypothetical protein [Verrucomicrobiales bacterium]
MRAWILFAPIERDSLNSPLAIASSGNLLEKTDCLVWPGDRQRFCDASQDGRPAVVIARKTLCPFPCGSGVLSAPMLHEFQHQIRFVASSVEQSELSRRRYGIILHHGPHHRGEHVSTGLPVVDGRGPLKGALGIGLRQPLS